MRSAAPFIVSSRFQVMAGATLSSAGLDSSARHSEVIATPSEAATARPKQTRVMRSTASHQHLALFADGVLHFFVGDVFAEQHLVVRLTRGDHREAVGELGYAAIEHHRALVVDHLANGVVEVIGVIAAHASPAVGIGELHEIGERFGVALGETVAVQELLPLAHHAMYSLFRMKTFTGRRYCTAVEHS